MKSFWHFIYVFTIAALAVLLFLKTCKKTNDGSAGVVTILKEVRTDTIKGESINHPVPVPYPVYSVDTVHIHDTTPGKPYPVEVIREKLVAANIPLLFYPDTLWLGNKGYVALRDTVRGLITARSFDWKVFETTTTITKSTPERQRNKMYLGLEYGWPSNYLGAAAMFQFKNDVILKAGYGYIKRDPHYNIGIFTKIKLRK